MGNDEDSTPTDSQGEDQRPPLKNAPPDPFEALQEEITDRVLLVAMAGALAALDPSKTTVCAGTVKDLTDYIVKLHVDGISRLVKESELESRIEGTEYWLLRLAEAVQKQQEERAKDGSKGADKKWNKNPDVASKAERDAIKAEMVTLKRNKPNWTDEKVAEYVKKRRTLSTSLETLRSQLNRELNRLKREVK